jgi:hypothetical protein
VGKSGCRAGIPGINRHNPCPSLLGMSQISIGITPVVVSTGFQPHMTINRELTRSSQVLEV